MMRRRIPPLALGIAALLCGSGALLLSACTTRSAYEGMRQGGRETCQYKSPESARAACFASLQDTFDSYTEERQSAREQVQRTEAARKVCYDLPEGPDRSDCLKRAH